MAPVFLRLFITGNSARSRSAIQRVQAVVNRLPADHVALEIIDILENPAAADAARILATPSLVRIHPQPSIRVVGDMSDESVLQAVVEGPISRYVN